MAIDFHRLGLSSLPSLGVTKMGSYIASDRPFDDLLTQIAEYAVSEASFSDEAYQTAAWCLMDSIGCGLLALRYPACTKMLGPVVPGAICPRGSRVPGFDWELDPVTAAFNIGCMIRWLDYNDTWLAAEWGHPSDNFGAILALADYLDRNTNPITGLKQKVTVRDILTAAIKAYEIQGVLALENGFNRVGLDHVLLVRIASTAVAASMLGGDVKQVAAAVSQAWIDGSALRTYRHAPNTGSRKSWAAGDATRRAVQLALWTMTGEMGYATALTAPKWGFQDVILGGKPVVLARPFGNYVMENILFKVSYPAEFHAQTAAEAAIQLHTQVIQRLDQIDRVVIETQESAMRIINKQGLLTNPADRDHCIQYITAAGLLFGTLDAEHYEDRAAADPRIDKLREKMNVVENTRYTKEYLDSDKRSIANSVQVFFLDGTATPQVEIEYPLGHRRRRKEAVPLIKAKFQQNVGTKYVSTYAKHLSNLFQDRAQLETTSASDFMSQWTDRA